jgi:hypothetical protein
MTASTQSASMVRSDSNCLRSNSDIILWVAGARRMLILEYLWIPMMFILHQYGQYVLSRKESIYKGWGVLPTPHIKMSRPSAQPQGTRSYFL